MTQISLHNPAFATYANAAALIILKAVAMSWLTVLRMIQVRGGYRSPEDLRKTPLNPNPNPAQLQPNEAVERIRRIQLNDLENLLYFLTAGFLYVLTDPSLIARSLLYGYVVSRLLHFLAYFTAPTHDMRATLWSSRLVSRPVRRPMCPASFKRRTQSFDHQRHLLHVVGDHDPHRLAGRSWFRPDEAVLFAGDGKEPGNSAHCGAGVGAAWPKAPRSRQ